MSTKHLAELLDRLANAIVTLEGVALICILIALVALYNYLRFRARIAPTVREFKQACDRLKSIEGEEGFAAEYYAFDEAIKKSSMLQHAWHEFSETLLLPDPDLDDGPDVVRNTADADAYFSRQTILQPIVDLRWYSAVPNILTGMGIMFTFVGLVAGIYLASDGLGGGVEEAKQALERLLGGASLAFMTSIVGLFFSLLFSALEKRWVHRFDRLINEWVNELDNRLSRVTPEHLARESLKEARQQTSIFAAFSNDLAFSISKVLEEQVKAPMSEAMERLVSAVEGLRADQGASNEAMLKEVVSQFSDSIQGAAGTEMEAFAETVRSLNDNLVTSVNELSEVAKDIGTITGDTAKILDRTGELVNEIQEAYEHLTGAADPLVAAADRVQEGSAALQDAALKVTGSTDSIGQAVENLAELQENVKAAWDDYQSRFEDVDNSLGRTFQEIDDGLSRYTSSMREFVEQLDAHASSIVRDLSGAVKELGEGIEELREVMEASGETAG
ncbi:uncharacterized protein FOKN1_1353 [Thiohalobacter thiocyanaticus]|uniref:MotA/TolQ/ExbB proton channel domain-containing protein n=1 Tax=Thiohalobacter thiocyanaticus TaxID=585455 RepID=A0A1Z4VQ58_9GAMM|nr:anti-phage ZorAB system protein ZorA [Thiohalobacter thiocyanaticus]BAZ93751.1 uncharacterized protein FOKN1_1353 [Thiohalobacter thiocyanaticus]